MNREEVIEYLKSLKLIDIIRIFYEIVAPRRDEYFVEEDGRSVVEEAFVVASAIFVDAGEDSTGIQVIAIPPVDFYERGDSPICQSGKCSKCQALVTGFAKSGVCPICLNDVYMT